MLSDKLKLLHDTQRSSNQSKWSVVSFVLGPLYRTVRVCYCCCCSYSDCCCKVKKYEEGKRGGGFSVLKRILIGHSHKSVKRKSTKSRSRSLCFQRQSPFGVWWPSNYRSLSLSQHFALCAVKFTCSPKSTKLVACAAYLCLWWLFFLVPAMTCCNWNVVMEPIGERNLTRQS